MSKSVAIFTYSLTGTTQHLANTIAQELETVGGGQVFEKPEQYSLVDLFKQQSTPEAAARTTSSTIARSSVIGIGGLAWYWKEPPMVRDWISQIPAHCLAGKPVFLFISAGSSAGKAFDRLEHEIALKGAYVVGTVTQVVGTSNFFMYTSKRLLISNTGFEAAHKEAHDLAEALAVWSKPSHPPVVKGPRDAVDDMVSGCKGFMMPITVDKSRCSKCLLCVKGCPANCIDVEDVGGYPRVDFAKCLACCRCMNRCPSRAIGPQGLVGTSHEFYGTFKPSQIQPGKTKEFIRPWQLLRSAIPTFVRMYPKKALIVVISLLVGLFAMMFVLKKLLF